jgi:hypothetical protein
MTDPVVEACRRVRDQIVQRAGGFEGYFNQLEELDRQRLRVKQKSGKRAKRVPKKRGRSGGVPNAAE